MENVSNNVDMRAHANLIEELGGPTAVAVALWGEKDGRGRGVWRVSKWKENGIAWQYRPQIAELATKCGVSLPAGFLLPGHDDQPSATDEKSAA